MRPHMAWDSKNVCVIAKQAKYLGQFVWQQEDKFSHLNNSYQLHAFRNTYDCQQHFFSDLQNSPKLSENSRFSCVLSLNPTVILESQLFAFRTLFTRWPHSADDCINLSAGLAPLCFFLSPSAWGDCYCWPLLSQQCWLQACLRLRSPSPAQRRTRRRHPRWQSTLSTITTTAATSSVSRTSSLPKQRKRWVQLKEEKHSQGCVEEKVIFTKIFLLLLLLF